jgi:hypothetical protein
MAVMLALASVGCIEPSSVVCNSGRICPPGSRCDVMRDRCVEFGQDLPCVGQPEDSACKFRDFPGTCRGGVCERNVCGDGYVTDTEDCEGAELGGETCESQGYYGETSGLACTSDCKFNRDGCVGRCGDGMINGDELCDGDRLGGADCRSLNFYEARGLACLPNCTFDDTGCTGGSCGDGAVNGPEACDGAPPPERSCLDHGFERGLLGCSELCGSDVRSCANLGWNLVEAPLQANGTLRAIWGAGLDDVFAVGADTIRRWDGTTWTSMPLELDKSIILEGVWGSSGRDVFAVGSCESCDPPRSGVVLHWDGTAWSEMVLDPRDSTQGFTSVWGSGPTDVYVASAPALLHWDGSIWTRAPLTMSVRSLWGSGRDDVFAAGVVGSEAYGVVSHFDGTRWSESTSRQPYGSYDYVVGTRRDDVYAVVTRNSVAGSLIVHWDGRGWSPFSPPERANIWAVWSNGPGELFVSSAEMIQHWDGARWSDAKLTTSAAFFGIWGAPGNAFAVGSLGAIARWDAAAWTPLISPVVPVGVPDTTPRPLTVVWASGPDDVYAVGTPDGSSTSQLVRWDGARWTRVVLEGDRGVRAVWGRGPSDVFAVGGGGMIQHRDGSRWSPMTSDTSFALTAVWGSGPQDVFAIDSRGLVLHSDGGAWTPISQPSLLRVESAWGSGPDDIYATDSLAAVSVHHWDGVAWAEAAPGPGLWKGVWGSSRSDVYVVGVGDAIAHWDGTSWRPMTVGRRDLRVVAGSGAGDVFAAGEGVDALLHLRAGTWEPIALPSGSSAYGLGVTPRQVFTGTSFGALRLDRRSISCVGPERNCRNGWDDDCDGRGDETDPDCRGEIAEVCANAADDDGDGQADCADPDCAEFLPCARRR